MKRRQRPQPPKPRHPIMPWLEDGFGAIVLIVLIIIALHFGAAIEAIILEGRQQ